MKTSAPFAPGQFRPEQERQNTPENTFEKEKLFALEKAQRKPLFASSSLTRRKSLPFDAYETRRHPEKRRSPPPDRVRH